MRLIRSVVTFGGLTGISRVFGLIREMLIARMLGASIVTDAFFVAFKFPNFFRRIFAEGAFSAVFVPQFSQLLVGQDRHDEAQQFANRTFSFLAAFLSVFVVLVVIFAPEIMHIMAPGFVTMPERFELAVSFTRLTFPYILFISLAAHLSGVLNSFDRFAAAAGVPIILNIVMIAAIFVSPYFNVSYGTGLSVAVMIAGVLQFGWLYIACHRLNFRVKLVWPRLTPDIKQLLRRMGPGVISAGMMNINLFVDMMLASLLPENSISYLTYADRLNQLPLSMIGIAIGTALLPSLSRKLKALEFENASKIQLLAVEFSMQLGVPAAVGLMVLSYPLIKVIYGLPVDQCKAIAWALTALAAGIPAYILNKVFSTCFFARQDTRTPAKIAMISIILNIVFNLCLMWHFAHVGMAMATTLAAWVNILILYQILKKRDWLILSRSLKITLLKMSVGVVLMGAGLGILQWYVRGHFAPTTLNEIINLAISIIVGFAIFISCSLWLKSLKLEEVKQALTR